MEMDIENTKEVINMLIRNIGSSKSKTFSLVRTIASEISNAEEQLSDIAILKKRYKEAIESAKVAYIETRNEYELLKNVSNKGDLDATNSTINKVLSQIENRSKRLKHFITTWENYLIKLEEKEELYKERHRKLKKQFANTKRIKKDIASAHRLVYDKVKYTTQLLEDQQNVIAKLHLLQERDRKNFARELHDTVLQSYSATLKGIELCKKYMKVNPEKLEEKLDELMDIIRTQICELRELIIDLRMPVVRKEGLAIAIEKYIDKIFSISENTEIAVQLKLDSIADMRFPPYVEFTVMRIIQESVNNTIKHSEATQIEIQVEYLDDKLFIFIYDNGKGCVIEEISKKAQENNKFGLLGIQERVKLLGGRLDLVSSPYRGMKTKAVLPAANVVKELNE